MRSKFLHEKPILHVIHNVRGWGVRKARIDVGLHPRCVKRVRREPRSRGFDLRNCATERVPRECDGIASSDILDVLRERVGISSLGIEHQTPCRREWANAGRSESGDFEFVTSYPSIRKKISHA